ncbi:hypothetical protein [Methanococcoides sp. NM1]|uniref:hypothetical protein n=1 Tax=Methanococcoides sp. NM1 TaxID=1201013 RepID=UPI0014385126|nr:hypothetical protein [Methanococcoides sp. NM1]
MEIDELVNIVDTFAADVFKLYGIEIEKLEAHHSTGIYTIIKMVTYNYSMFLTNY